MKKGKIIINQNKDILSKEEAKKIIAFNEENMAHTFYNTGFGLIGGNHSKASLFKDIDKSIECKKAGFQALNMSHGLVVIPKYPCNQEDLLFVETKPDFNKKELDNLGAGKRGEANK